LRVAIAFGTRPEVIKVAPIYLEMKKRDIDTLLIATAQHREMMDMMLEVFGMKPDIDLNIMTHGQTPNTVASKVLVGIEEVLKKENVDILVVHGDTTTAMASALSAFHLGLKVAHVEAGLRSGNLRDPFPEEMNRKVIDVFSDYAFAPTKRSKENLLGEGVGEERIFVTGNTVVDALEYIRRSIDLDSKGTVDEEGFVLVMMHRRENWGERMESALKGLRRFSEETGIKIVFPVHKNPVVRETVDKVLKGYENAVLLEPVDYVEFLSLLEKCSFVMTDSGGVQEEAPSFGKFVVVARNTTERPELVENGWGVLAGTSEEGIYNALKKAMNFSPKGKKNPFGDGRASERIVKVLEGREYDEFEG
jgi:UDP-N-acetylglucosamine 2-epimerase (non-hydrolysing)